jgi:hypothetical protein
MHLLLGGLLFTQKNSDLEQFCFSEMKAHKNIKIRLRLGGLLKPVILATWEAVIKRITVQGQSTQKFHKSLSQPTSQTWCRAPVILAIWANTSWKIEVQADASIKQESVSKITRAKRAAGVAIVVEHLPSKHEALNSNPNIAKKKNG